MTAAAEHIANAIRHQSIDAAEIARRMHTSEANVSRWRAGKVVPSAEQSRALAEVLHVPEDVFLAECEADRAKDEATRAIWLRVARFLRQAANTKALMAVAAVVLYTTGPENAFANQHLANANFTSYKLSRLWARIRRLARAAQERLSAKTGPGIWSPA